ncbi:unnamed protein product [Ectocarpus sp. 12 AP-2014]
MAASAPDPMPEASSPRDDDKGTMDVGEEEEEEEEEVKEMVPDMNLAQRCWVAVHQQDPAAAASILDTVKERNMGPWYASLCHQHPSLFPLDAALAAKMKEVNEAEKERISETLKAAEEGEGDMEVLDAQFEMAKMWASVGDKTAAYAAYETITEKAKISTGKKIDAIMAKTRVALFHLDTPQVKAGLDAAKKMIDLGGDWDRRNRLKVYEALHLITSRDIKGAATLLLECVSTFTCTELCSYNDFILYTVVTNILTLPRTTLKKKIVDGPEVLAVINEIPNISALVNSLYDCRYRDFMMAVVELNGQLENDRYFATHSTYLVRELRILAYTQFLDAYKSVVLGTMAAAFGVGEPFLDKELSRFIAAGRLNAKIDKVGGVVETNRPDSKNAQYQACIKQGDLLLNRVQKLGRVVDA